MWWCDLGMFKRKELWGEKKSFLDREFWGRLGVVGTC